MLRFSEFQSNQILEISTYGCVSVPLSSHCSPVSVRIDPSMYQGGELSHTFNCFMLWRVAFQYKALQADVGSSSRVCWTFTQSGVLEDV